MRRNWVSGFKDFSCKRLLIMADPKDTIFPLESIVRKVGQGAPWLTLDLGRHEFPFNVPTLDKRKFRDVAEEIKKSYVPSEAYWLSFNSWVEWATAFFQGVSAEVCGEPKHGALTAVAQIHSSSADHL